MNDYLEVASRGSRINQGQNIRLFREGRKWKQEMLASRMGEPWTQRKVSELERQEVIEVQILALAARALDMPVELLESFEAPAAHAGIHAESITNSNVVGIGNHFQFNPIEKIVELYEARLIDQRKLYEELIAEHKAQRKIAELELRLVQKQLEQAQKSSPASSRKKK